MIEFTKPIKLSLYFIHSRRWKANMLSREIKGIKGRETTGEDYWTGRHRNETNQNETLRSKRIKKHTDTEITKELLNNFKCARHVNVVPEEEEDSGKESKKCLQKEQLNIFQIWCKLQTHKSKKCYETAEKHEAKYTMVLHKHFIICDKEKTSQIKKKTIIYI